MHVPGRHNALNATAAVAIAHQLEVAPGKIAEGLKSFRGVDRRFQLRGEARGITVVDDYGHHPTEIRATLAAARECGHKRIHVIFQPHRYTRTRDLLEEFGTAFVDADTVVVLPIYAASEEPFPASGLSCWLRKSKVQPCSSLRTFLAVSVSTARQKRRYDPHSRCRQRQPAGPQILAALEDTGQPRSGDHGLQAVTQITSTETFYQLSDSAIMRRANICLS